VSYSLVIARRRIEALERRPSAQKPMVIRGGIPRDVNRTSPGTKQTDSLRPNKPSPARDGQNP
jgi:hypothetical protein